MKKEKKKNENLSNCLCKYLYSNNVFFNFQQLISLCSFLIILTDGVNYYNSNNYYVSILNLCTILWRVWMGWVIICTVIHSIRLSISTIHLKSYRNELRMKIKKKCEKRKFVYVFSSRTFCWEKKEIQISKSQN